MDIGGATAILEEAAFLPETMPEALERSGRALGFDHFFLFRMEEGRPDFVAAPEANERISDYIKSGWWQVDHRTHYNRKKMHPGIIVRDHLTVPEKVRADSSIYNELYIPGGWNWNSVWQFNIAGEKWAFSGMRSGEAGPLSDDDATALLPMIQVANRSAMMAVKLRDASIKGQAEGIWALGHDTIMLDHKGHVCLTSPGIERILGDDFNIRRGELWASHRSSQLGIAAMVQFAKGQSSRIAPPDCVLRRRNGLRPIIARALPTRGSVLDALPGVRLILVLTDLEAKPRPPTHLLQTAFGLTARECEAAVLLATGLGPMEIAEQLSLSIFTVRSHVKNIFAKTECRRQSELASLIARLPD